MPSPIDPLVRSRSFRAAFRPCPSPPTPPSAVPRPSAPSTTTTATSSSSTSSTTTTTGLLSSRAETRFRDRSLVATRTTGGRETRRLRARGSRERERATFLPSLPPPCYPPLYRVGPLRAEAPAKIHRRWPEQNCRARAAAALNTRPDRSSPPTPFGFSPLARVPPPVSAAVLHSPRATSLSHPLSLPSFSLSLLLIALLRDPRLHSFLPLSFSISHPPHHLHRHPFGSFYHEKSFSSPLPRELSSLSICMFHLHFSFISRS